MNQKSAIWSTGLAMFAMFFGAGNIVFPLALGQFTQDKNFYGVLGMILTAVIVPLAGLLAMLLYNGDYHAFFKRIGKLPGFVITVLILALIGPFAGIPRCITISYSTLHTFGLDSFHGVNLVTFSLFSCLLIFLFTCRPSKIVSLLGYFLTPVLLLSLGLIAIKGLWAMPHADLSSHTRWETFAHGLLDGYNTMDLLAAFFFSSVVLLCLKKKGVEEEKKLVPMAALGSIIAALLLATVYVSFSFVSAGFGQRMDGIASHELLGTLAYQLLGPYAGLIAGVAVSFACLTTEIALAAVFAGFLHETLFKGKLSYRMALVLTLAIAFSVSTLNFNGISRFLVPILQIFYPALIVLTLLNILHKLVDFQPVKRIFYAAVLLSLLTWIVF